MLLFLVAKAAEDASKGVAEGGIVSCSGLDCDFCALLKSITNLINWLTWDLTAPMAIFFVVVGGLVYIGARGMESWMALAKRTVTWAIMGFTFVIIAWLAVQNTMLILGATNSFFSKVECNTDSGAILPNLPTKSVDEILAELKGKGTAGGILPSGTKLEEFKTLYNKIQDGKVVIYITKVLKERKPVVAIGKRNGLTEILFVDRTFIQKAFQTDPKLGFKVEDFFNVTRAASTFSNENNPFQTGGTVASADSESQKTEMEVAQIMSQLVKKGREVSMVIVNRSDFNLNAYGEIPVNKIVNVVKDFESCLGTGGVWSRFNNVCYFDIGNCDPDSNPTTKGCNPATFGNLSVEGCQCPVNKCRLGNACLDRNPLGTKK